MKHTKGEWIVKEWDQTGTDFYHIRSKDKFTSLIATVFRWKGHIDKMEAKANAKLIAEAGTVTNKTGYTPRQLVDQKAELLEALLNLVNTASGDTLENLKIAIIDAKAVIKKSKP